MKGTLRIVRKLLAGDGWINLASNTTGTEGVEVEFELAGEAPATVFLWDATADLPKHGNVLLAARPPEATRFQAGDRTLVAKELTLSPAGR